MLRRIAMQNQPKKNLSNKFHAASFMFVAALCLSLFATYSQAEESPFKKAAAPTDEKNPRFKTAGDYQP